MIMCKFDSNCTGTACVFSSHMLAFCTCSGSQFKPVVFILNIIYLNMSITQSAIYIYIYIQKIVVQLQYNFYSLYTLYSYMFSIKG